MLRNDERILDAAFTAAAEDGWPGLSFAAIARRAGLTRRPVQERFDTISDLMAATWAMRAHPVIQPLLESALTLAGTVEARMDDDALVAHMRDLSLPDAERVGAMELLLLGQFDARLQAAIDSTLGEWLRPLLNADDGDAERAACRSYIVSLAFGLILSSRRPGVEGLNIDSEIRRIARALRHPAPATPLPTHRPEHMDGPLTFDTGDPTRDGLLSAVLEEVGSRGFDGTNVGRIVRRAGSSQGAMFARFPTKQALFLEATRRHNEMTLALNEMFMSEIAAATSLGIAEAVYIREAQLPEHRQLAALVLEQLRLSWHDLDLMAARARAQDDFDESYAASLLEHAPEETRESRLGTAHIGSCIGIGVLIPPMLVPWVHDLPHQVITDALIY